jgi:hypothetical protein
MQLPNKEAKKCNLLPGKNAQLQGIKLIHHLLLQYSTDPQFRLYSPVSYYQKCR